MQKMPRRQVFRLYQPLSMRSQFRLRVRQMHLQITKLFSQPSMLLKNTSQFSMLKTKHDLKTGKRQISMRMLKRFRNVQKRMHQLPKNICAEPINRFVRMRKNSIFSQQQHLRGMRSYEILRYKVRDMFVQTTIL